jgi:hypothetical protein
MSGKTPLTAAQMAEISEIEATVGLTTENVVARAKDERSALHEYSGFKWNVHEAAEEHYRDVARQIMRVYVTVIDRGDGERVTARAYVNVTTPDNKHVYRKTTVVLREDRGTIINKVLDQILGLVRSYPLPEFDPLIAEVDAVRRRLTEDDDDRPRRRARGGRRTRQQPRA